MVMAFKRTTTGIQEIKMSKKIILALALALVLVSGSLYRAQAQCGSSNSSPCCWNWNPCHWNWNPCNWNWFSCGCSGANRDVDRSNLNPPASDHNLDRSFNDQNTRMDQNLNY